MALCKNCEVSLTDGVRYCPSCGQSVHVHRLNTRFLFHEGVHYLTHADKGIFHLIRDLAVKRGVVAREYIAGKRRKYFSPLTFFMLVAAILVFGSMLGEAKQSSDFSKHPDVIKIVDPAERANMQGFLERRQKSHHFTNKYANLMAMASLPLTALVFWLFFRRRKYNYVEHLVAGMYMLGFCLLIYAVIILPLFYLMGRPRYYASMVFMAFHLIYFAVFYNGFLENRTLRDKAASLAASFTMIVAWAVITLSVIRLYITTGFWGLL
jgi:hypothetical protein